MNKYFVSYSWTGIDYPEDSGSYSGFINTFDIEIWWLDKRVDASREWTLIQVNKV